MKQGFTRFITQSYSIEPRSGKMNRGNLCYNPDIPATAGKRKFSGFVPRLTAVFRLLCSEKKLKEVGRLQY